MNREIKTKKVGRQKKLTNPCPVIKGETEVMVGSPRCITCQWFERKLEKNGKAYASTAIDYNSKENKVIEERIRNYYLPVKNVLETVRDRRINIPNSPGGLCVDLIEVSRTINIEFNLSNDGTYLWREVIRPWFTPQRFNLTDVYFTYCTPDILILGYGLTVDSKSWYKVPLEKLRGYELLLKTGFWFPTSKAYNNNRIKILECALEDLERIKREGEPELPPLTFEEPKIYP